MKIENSFKIPLVDLKIGDCIRIKNKLLFSFVEKESKQEIEEYLVVDKKHIHNSIKPDIIILLLINERARIEELRGTAYNCIELASWHFKPAVPVYAKQLEQDDYIAPWADERGARIISIGNRYAHATRDIVYTMEFVSTPRYSPIAPGISQPEHSYSTAHYQISALFDDIIYTPTKLLPENITENLPRCSQSISDAIQQYGTSLSLLLESFSLCTEISPCRFTLGSNCKNNGTHSNGRQKMCINCLKKVALISVYGGSSIVSAYNAVEAA